MHNLKANFDKFLEQINSVMSGRVSEDGNFREYPNKPKLSDSAVLALALCAEAMGIDSENYFWSKLTAEGSFAALMDRSNFNRRKRRLAPYLAEYNQKVADTMNEFEDAYIVDSMPLPVCNIARAGRARVCRQDFESAPDKGYSAITKSYFLGYKLHVVASVRGVFHSMQLSKASVHDINYLREVKYTLSDCLLLGDMGFLSVECKTDLFHQCNVDLQTPQRANQKNRQHYPYVYKKSRKRIETLFSQLCDQFMIKRNYAKTYNGFCTRIISKVAAFTTLQFFNLKNNKPINHVKHALSF